MPVSNQPLWVYGLAVVASAAAGWTGAAQGAWCSPPWLSCMIHSLPASVFGGLLFAGPALLAALLLAFVVGGLRMRLSVASVLVMMAVMWIAGFTLGISPGTHGQGP